MLYEKALPIHFLQNLSFPGDRIGLKIGFLILKKFDISPISRRSRFQEGSSQGNSRRCHWPGKPSPCGGVQLRGKQTSLFRSSTEGPFARD